MSIITTRSGRCVSLASPDPETIDIRDIACSLSRLNRFSGATLLPVNVADHSLNVVKLLAQRKAPDEILMLGLLHDAHEAYLGDITNPARAEIAAYAGLDVVARIADRLDFAILKAFGLWSCAILDAQAWVRTADAAVFGAEWRDLMPGRCPVSVEAAPFAIKPRNSDRSEEDFLKMFDLLRLKLGPRLQSADAQV